MFKQLLYIIITLFLTNLLMACGTAPQYNIVGTQGAQYFVVVDKSLTSDKAALQNVANEICNGKTVCIVQFWDDINLAANNLPMTDAQVNSKIGAYNLNKNKGLERLFVCVSGSCSE